MPPTKVRLQQEVEERNGDFKYTIFDTHNIRVGQVAISLWDNQPMLYLTRIEIEKDYRERGFGAGTLAALTQLHCRIILPVQESGRSIGFWTKMRSRSGEHFVVEDQISTTDWSILTRDCT